MVKTAVVYPCKFTKLNRFGQVLIDHNIGYFIQKLQNDLCLFLRYVYTVFFQKLHCFIRWYLVYLTVAHPIPPVLTVKARQRAFTVFVDSLFYWLSVFRKIYPASLVAFKRWHIPDIAIFAQFSYTLVISSRC